MKHNCNGVILIVVLWIIVVSLVMVTILASNVRLSVGTILHQHDALQNHAKLMAAVNLAKMQILIEKTSTRRGNIQNSNASSFNGSPVTFSYQYETGMVVRIVDLSGLINISHISRDNFKLIIEKRLAENFYEVAEGSNKIEDLLDAWQDWIDHDNLTHLNGAEQDYYQQQVPSYVPRNARLETVEELKLIRGFSEVFKDLDLTTVFSIYGNSKNINPNLASRATLLFIPGITESLADTIIEQRNISPFNKMSDFYQLFSADEINKIKPWFSLRKSNFFAIIVYPQESEKNAFMNADSNAEIFAYKELVQYKGFNRLPETLMVYPMSQFKLYPRKRS